MRAKAARYCTFGLVNGLYLSGTFRSQYINIVSSGMREHFGQQPCSFATLKLSLFNYPALPSLPQIHHFSIFPSLIPRSAIPAEALRNMSVVEYTLGLEQV